MDGLGLAARTPFVGRSDEVAWLERTLERAWDGRPAIVVLTGEAGIGKTRLLRETARRARRMGFRPLTGCSYEDLNEPFLPFIDALGDAVDELAASVPACADASDLLGVIVGRRNAEPRGGISESPDSSQLRVLRVLTRALFAISREQPVVLGLDDLHWADAPSLRLLEHLALRLDDEVFGSDPLRLVVIVGTRRDERSPSAVTLDRLRGEAAVTTLHLRGLDNPEVGDLLRSGHGIDLPPVVVRRLATVTRGNPLHLESLVASVDRQELATIDDRLLHDAGVPGSVGTVIARSFERLPAIARRVMDVVAATSGEADTPLIASVLGVDTGAAEAAIAACVEAGVLTGGLRPDFAHPVHRHVCLTDLTPSTLSSLHADVLAALQTLDDVPTPERLARHALGAGGAIDASVRAQLAIDAGMRRLAATDWGSAAELFDAARALGPAAIDEPLALGDLELNAAVCHSWTGGVSDLEERFRAAADWYAKADSTAGVALSHLAAVRARLNTGTWGQGIDVSELEDQLDLLVDDHPELAALVQADLAMALWVGGQPRPAAEAARVAVRMAEQADSHAAGARAHTALGLSLLTELELAESRAAFERGLEIAEAGDDPLEQLMVLIRLPLATGLLGDTRACRQYAERARDLCRRLDSPHDAEFALAALCNLAGTRGDLISVEQLGTEVRSIARLTGSPWTLPFVLAATAATRAVHGDVAGAGAALHDLLPSDPGLSAWVADSPTHRVMAGYLACLAGDPAEAARQVTPEVVHDLLEQPAVLGNGAYLAAVVETAAALDQPALADAVRPALADLVHRGQVCAAGMPFLLPRSLGLAERMRGRLDEAKRLLEEALDVARREDLDVERVRALLDLADVASLEGRARPATDLRATAAADIRRMGLWGLATRAGVRPPTAGTRAALVEEPVEALAVVRSVILFADISASTRLTEELGDVAFRYRARQADAAMRSAVSTSGGRAIEGIRLGDGILAEHPTARAAVVAAASMIAAVEPSGLRVHVGVHQGDVIHDDLSIFGGAVNMAARICDQAGPGELVVSEPIARELEGDPQLTVVDLGDRSLKGFDAPVRLFRVEAADSTTVIPTTKE